MYRNSFTSLLQLAQAVLYMQPAFKQKSLPATIKPPPTQVRVWGISPQKK
jgi:hypothetical protein